MKPQINFIHRLDGFQCLGDEHKRWIERAVNAFNYSISELNFTFMSDDDLLKINKDYLNHNFYTDIITFDNTIGKVISADIAISYDRVKENAKALDIDLNTELNRVMIHGVLHCLGFEDHTEEQKHKMRELEDDMLNMFHVEHQKMKRNV